MNTLESKVILIITILAVIPLLYQNLHTQKEIRHFFRKLKRAISWGIFMFSNEEWDFHYLQRLLVKRLTELEKSYSNHSTKEYSHIHTHSYCRILRLAISYLKEQDKEDDQDDLTKTFGKTSFSFSPPDEKGYCSLTILWGGKVNKEASVLSATRFKKFEDHKAKCYKRFWYLMEKYIGNMWD